MTPRNISFALVCFILAVMRGCGSPASRLVGEWENAEEHSQVNIEKDGDAFMVEVVQNGETSKFPGKYEDGTITIQNMWVTVSFYRDNDSGDLVANMGGQEERYKRK